MWNARLDEIQAGIKIVSRNINNHRYAEDTPFMAESEEELKSLLIKVKEWKSWLKTQHSENDHGIQFHHFMANRWGKNGNTDRFYFLWLQNYCRLWLHHLFLGRKAMTNPVQFSSVQLLSYVRLFVTPWTAAHQASLSITNSQSWLKLMSIELVMPSNHLILCHPLLLLPSIFFSIRVFSNESVLHITWPNIWVSTSTSVLPMSIQDWFAWGWTGWISLLFKGLKSLLHHHSSKASILQHLAFLIIQLSHPYVTAEKTIALTRQIFVGQVMSLLFKMLSSLVITFLPRSKYILISWLQSPYPVIMEPQKIKFSTVSPYVFHEVMGQNSPSFQPRQTQTEF